MIYDYGSSGTFIRFLKCHWGDQILSESVIKSCIKQLSTSGIQ